jgi:phospholipase/carboxylesterase
MSGDRRIVVSTDPASGTCRLAEQRFIPQRYEPNYAYPLLVLMHGRGGDEHSLVRSVPSMSWRNYVAVGLRGPEALTRDGQPSGYGWGPPFARTERRGGPWGPREDAAQTVRRVLGDGPPDLFDVIDQGVVAAVQGMRRSLHIHSERIFLVGAGEGAAAAFRLALAHPERFAGIVAMNGWLPRSFPALTRWKDCRDLLKVLVVHGEWNGRVPIERTRRDVQLLRNAGLKVAFQGYPCANRVTRPMLSDVDTWVMHQCTMCS